MVFRCRSLFFFLFDLDPRRQFDFLAVVVAQPAPPAAGGGKRRPRLVLGRRLGLDVARRARVAPGVAHGRDDAAARAAAGAVGAAGMVDADIVVVVVAVAVVGPAKGVGHGARQHDADGGQAGDDHGDAELQAGPDQGAGVVPGRVPAGGEMDHEAEADAAGQEDEEAQAEHEEDLGPLAHGRVQVGQQGDGHDEDDDVLRDAEPGRRVGQRAHVQARVAAAAAVAAVPPQPDKAQRPALEDLQEEEDEPAGGDPADAGQAGAAKPLLGEDAQVEEEDGDLGDGQDGDVEGLVDVEEQEGVAQRVGVHFPDVDAERDLARCGR